MKIVVGLGNPGQQYQKTRHNVGFELLEELRRNHGGAAPRKKFDAEISEISLGGERILLVAPQTFMNLSGTSVQKVVSFFQSSTRDLLIVCDDFSLPLGRIRFRPNGSSGGQKGLQSTIQHLGTQEIPRLRLGIGPVPEGRQSADFVLGKFSREEQSSVESMLSLSSKAVEEWVKNGIASAMNLFNSDQAKPEMRERGKSAGRDSQDPLPQ